MSISPFLGNSQEDAPPSGGFTGGVEQLHTDLENLNNQLEKIQSFLKKSFQYKNYQNVDLIVNEAYVENIDFQAFSGNIIDTTVTLNRQTSGVQVYTNFDIGVFQKDSSGSWVPLTNSQQITFNSSFSVGSKTFNLEPYPGNGATYKLGGFKRGMQIVSVVQEPVKFYILAQNTNSTDLPNCKIVAMATGYSIPSAGLVLGY